MPRFFTGDELGAIKSVKYTHDVESKQWKPEVTVLAGDASAGRVKAIQKLTMQADEDNILLSAFRADGSTSLIKLDADNAASETSSWKESRLKEGQRFVGAALTKTGAYSCTSNGALRLTKPDENTTPSHTLGVLPMRLAEWRLAPNEETFAYAGDEVELSVWNTECAFSAEKPSPSESDAQSKKRKRSEQLLPGEIWRAKNLPNDNLNLRQPVRNNALTYLQPSPNASQHHLLVGTQLGDVRRYDTRAARRPVANWTGVAKVGGIGVVENGTCEHQVFVADQGCNLFALDLRNGKVSYGYKGLAGAVTSVAPTPGLMASGAEDRFLRLHSTFAPPAQVGGQQEHKGEVLDKLYVKVKPTVVLWDGKVDVGADGEADGSDAEDADDVWENMEDVDSDDERAARKKSKAR